MSWSYPLDDYGFERYEENIFPLAYLLTFTTYGTRLHGDFRGSYQRSRDPRFGTIKREPNVPLNDKMRSALGARPVILNGEQRAVVESAFVEVCEVRGYAPRAINVRSNHAHAVIAGQVKPEKIVNELKAYATRNLRQRGLAPFGDKVWTRGASTRYLWKPAHLAGAIDYVLYSQGDDPPGTVIGRNFHGKARA
jgi:REP element-mobilizing transposase RayT